MFNLSVLTVQNAPNISSPRLLLPCQELWDLGARKHIIATDTVSILQNCDWILTTTMFKYLAPIWHFDYSWCSVLWTQARSRRGWGRNRLSTQNWLLEHPKLFGVLADGRSNSRIWNRIFRPDTKANSTFAFSSNARYYSQKVDHGLAKRTTHTTRKREAYTTRKRSDLRKIQELLTKAGINPHSAIALYIFLQRKNIFEISVVYIYSYPGASIFENHQI